ncbi:uncharacterized protein MICPUCDRAFT_58199 [Micromonas pusilla CCMP1545]|uniref:Predicted protein n=2 Tax=Micromonas pusilla TaxID=38833 RepID=C1MRR5_MICPC|nr:uncharacterized protein MICPUCDRAFT_58199 [Micromonas pusilla CCMP1545]EEH57010.1 predicted protein [Micromonas pusilla CCMP1545]|eukprot:XP_003058555.1 predicted protein [Micromonas pusilla CCMP1545]
MSQAVRALARVPRANSRRGVRLEANAEGARRSPRDVRLRKGTDGDLSAIRASVLSEGMNPLGLDPSRFVVAVDDGDVVVGFGQVRPWETLSDRADIVGGIVRGLGLAPNWRGSLLEVASLLVTKDRRGEGVGSAILRELIADATADASKETTLCLLTLRGTTSFYERFGFRITEEENTPRPLMAERAIGNVVAGVIANDECVCMTLERRR